MPAKQPVFAGKIPRHKNFGRMSGTKDEFGDEFTQSPGVTCAGALFFARIVLIPV
jgi:hypothetical protein